LQDGAVETLRNELVPFARVITPNVPEAEILLGRGIDGWHDFLPAVRELSAACGVSVLLKAGHLDGEWLTDVFYNAETGGVTELASERIRTVNTHGTGCTLSSAVAAFLAHGLPLDEAVRRAKEYLVSAIAAGARYETGRGHGPVHHFFGFWE
jgi:hydroxymethylpyrimidine/phosphomethylpyrimidine kinase